MNNNIWYFNFPVNTTTAYPIYFPLTSAIPPSPVQCVPPEKPKQQKIKRGNTEGYECKDCMDFCPMAELNMPEGSKDCDSFRCYTCRNGLRTLFQINEVKK